MSRIPFTTKLRYVFASPVLWFGFVFFVLGSIGAYVFLSELNLYRAWALWGAKGLTEGVVLQTEPTNTAVDDQLVFRYTYAFSSAETPHKSHKGYAFGYAVHEPGTPVQVKYVPGRPEISLPEGMQLNHGGWTSLFILIFPMFGALLIFGSIYKRADDLATALEEISLMDEAEEWVAYDPENPKKALKIDSMPEYIRCALSHTDHRL
jgi:hypothetical protein